MTTPEEIRRVVDRMRRGLPPAPEPGTLEACRGCRMPYDPQARGAAEGWCPSCAANKRRAGLWHTPKIGE